MAVTLRLPVSVLALWQELHDWRSHMEAALMVGPAGAVYEPPPKKSEVTETAPAESKPPLTAAKRQELKDRLARITGSRK